MTATLRAKSSDERFPQTRWSAQRLDHVCDIARRIITPDQLGNEPVLHYSIPALEATGRPALEHPAGIDSNKLLLTGGEVLVSRLNPRKGRIIQVGSLNDHRAVCSSEFIVLIPRAIDGRFLWYLLSADGIRQFLDSEVRSATRSHQRVEPEVITKMWVHVPSAVEQRAIVIYLDRECARIDAMLAEQEHVIAGLQEARAAVVSHLLRGGELLPETEHGGSRTHPLPDAWRRTRLKFLGEVRGGVTKGRQLDAGTIVRVPYLRVANVQDGYLDLSEVGEIEVEQHEVDRYRLRPGDVLMNEGGDNDKLGRGTVWRGELPLCLHQNHVFAFRPNDVTLSEWVAEWTRTASAKAYFERRAKQTTNLASISATNIGNLPILVPPANEREQLLRKLRARTGKLDECLEEDRRVGRLLREYRAALITAATTDQLTLAPGPA